MEFLIYMIALAAVFGLIEFNIRKQDKASSEKKANTFAAQARMNHVALGNEMEMVGPTSFRNVETYYRWHAVKQRHYDLADLIGKSPGAWLRLEAADREKAMIR